MTASFSFLSTQQRVCIHLERKRGEGDASSLKLNLTDPCRTVPCQYNGRGMPGRRAGSPIAVYARVQCQEPKTGQEKVQFYCEDDSLLLFPIIYLWFNLLDELSTQTLNQLGSESVNYIVIIISK